MISNIPEGYVEVNYDRVLMDVGEKDAIWFDLGYRKIWIPRSQIDEQFPEDKSLLVSRWFAEKTRLV